MTGDPAPDRPVFIFKPFDKDAEVVRSRRRLPHWQQPGVTYFVTWRLADAVSQEQLAIWIDERKRWLRAHPKPWPKDIEMEYRIHFQDRQDRYLDKGYGECILNREATAGIVAESLAKYDNIQYDLGPFVIMPNHVHALVAPRGRTRINRDSSRLERIHSQRDQQTQEPERRRLVERII